MAVPVSTPQTHVKKKKKEISSPRNELLLSLRLNHETITGT